MGWFGRKRAEDDREKRLAQFQRRSEMRVAELYAIATCANAVACAVLGALPIEQREGIISALKDMVDSQIGERGPPNLPKEYHRVYRNASSRVLQGYLQLLESNDGME